MAAGLGNEEIAARLMTGRRTPETHAARVLAQLALSSRSQLAAWSHARRTPPFLTG
ncbi:hypothetical protein J7E91_34875 [Streptomyces sp. ISL-99]|uniref:LuxR C-terminal-related transcriptional regulator n=1 Tax=Streptomyces sp. ISL-99 TaxID=2819193 RepID=UPI001BEBC4BB|nr:LuxR C-terminal-related transcriptional regulator [Streptomyces sp. ISL-99]MBT2530393.1 hypothetical protein [Streptomyces sp. ISL-99]